MAILTTFVSTAVGQDASSAAAPVVRRGSEAASEKLVPAPRAVLPDVFPQRIVAVLAAGQPGGRLDGRMAWTATPPREAGSSPWSVQPVAALEEPRRIALASISDRDQGPAGAEPMELQAREIGSVSAQTVALLLSGQRGGEIVGSLIWTVSPETTDDGSAEVLFFVAAEGGSLLEEHSNPGLDVGIFAYVFSDEGILVTHLAQGLNLDLQKYGRLLLSGGLKFAGRFSLAPGAYFIRLLVRNQNTGRLFLTQARIDVPEDQSDGSLLLPPLFHELPGEVVLVRQSDLAAGEVGVDLSEIHVVPAALAVVEARVGTAFIIGGAGWSDNPRIVARVADSSGRQLAEPMLTIDRRVGFSDGSVRFCHATLGPLDLPPGMYSLELMLDDEASGSRHSRYIPLVVVGTARRFPMEADLSGTGERIESTDHSLAAPLTELTREEFAVRYADALYLLAEGDRYGARDAVVELERLAIGAGDTLVMIDKVERQVVRDLAAVDPGVLLPISLLHHDVFRQHLAFGEDRLADHAWPLAADFVEQDWDEQRQWEGSDFTQTMLVALAADLVRTAFLVSAIDVLDRAVELAPGDPAALLALGATYERTGRYAEAVVPLQHLIRQHPDDAEGLLRLAVNLARTGDSEQAEAHFRNLIANSSQTWVAVISYQELARLLPEPAAETILREAVYRFPGNQALRVQLAFVLDDRGQTAEAARLIEDLGRQAAAPETSPRVRYPAWPSLGLGEKMVVLENAVASRLSALVTALDARAPEENQEDKT